MRLIVVLKRDAVAKVVLNNLYKHTQLQETFGANMLALVDGVPRTLTLDQFVTHWITHQIEVIQRRTRYRLRKAEERAHILRALLKALDALDEVIALIRASATVDDARTGLMQLLEIDEVQATAILDMQLRRLAALERQKITDEYDELMARIADYNDILVQRAAAALDRRRGARPRSSTSSATSAAPRSSPSTATCPIEDLIAEEDVVVTITRDGYAKRTKADLYRAQRRGGKGVRGAALKQDDIVEHFFTTTTHHWILFFTNQGRVYRAKAYELPDAGRDARGQHVANLLAFQPDEQIAQVLDLKDYEQAPYLVLATRGGMVKKTRLAEYDSNRSGGVIAINLARGRRGHLGGAVHRRRRPAAGVPQGSVRAFPRRRRHTASHGPCHAGCDRHEVPRQRRAARHGRRPRGRLRRHRHRRWVRQAHDGDGVDAQGSRHPRGQGHAPGQRGARRRWSARSSRTRPTRSSPSSPAVRSFAPPVGEIRATGRDTMGVTLTSVGEGDAVVAVTRNAEVRRAVDDDGEDDRPRLTRSAAADSGESTEADRRPDVMTTHQRGASQRRRRRPTLRRASGRPGRR